MMMMQAVAVARFVFCRVAYFFDDNGPRRARSRLFAAVRVRCAWSEQRGRLGHAARPSPLLAAGSVFTRV